MRNKKVNNNQRKLAKAKNALRMLVLILKTKPENQFFGSVQEQIKYSPTRYPSPRQWQCIQSTYNRLIASRKPVDKLESFLPTLDQEFVAIAS